MPLLDTQGNDSADAYQGGIAVVPNYIEDVFSTWLYTGTGAAQTITNGIDLSTKGGMVWFKLRTRAYNNGVFDSARGITKLLYTNTTASNVTTSDTVTSFNTNGFSLGIDSGWGGANGNVGDNYVSWTFRKQAKFFDIVTYTGDGQNNRQIAHSLGSTPGCIIVKCLYLTGGGGPANWLVYHQSLGATKNLYLNTTAAAFTGNGEFSAPTSTYFVVNQPGGGDTLNANGDQYVAYLFASNAGGFGLTGTDNVITCGSFTTDGSGNGSVTLGYEPQFLITKGTDGGTNWNMVDTMRGATTDGVDSLLRPNLSSAEISASNCFKINSTGFSGGSNILSPSTEIIYIAIRRGPMKVPTDATKVFSTATSTNGSFPTVTTTFPIDMGIYRSDRTATNNWNNGSRLTMGSNNGSTNGGLLRLNLTNAEVSDTSVQFDSSVGGWSLSGSNPLAYSFQRAPSFFDVVCYTGTGTTLNVDHNLGIAPELIIIKKRSATGDWFTGFSFGASSYSYAKINLSDSAASGGYGFAFGAQPTSTQFTPGSSAGVNGSGATYVAYLFATCAGVSKVGSYTGNGSTQTIDCGFTGGARFVLIKRTDNTGDWYVYDTARGMTTLTDPYLFLDSTAAETATLGSVTTVSTGFALNAALANININSASYIFLAIA